MKSPLLYRSLALLSLLLITATAGAGQHAISVGTAANDGTGDNLRTAFGKLNTDLAELFARPQGTVTSVQIAVPAGLTVSGGPVTTAGTITIGTALNGLVYGNGTGFGAATIGSGLTWNAGTHTLSATGGIDQSAVAITGGTINGTPIGANTPSTGAFTGVLTSAVNGSGPFGNSEWLIHNSSGAGIASLSGGQGLGCVGVYGDGVSIAAFQDGLLLSSTRTLRWSDGLASGSGSDLILGRAAANHLLQRNSTNEQIFTIGPSSTGIRSNAGELEAFDNAGNVTGISPHAQDAPAGLYERGPGRDLLQRRVNVFAAEIEWYNTTRREAIDLLDIAARTGAHEESVAAWTEFAQRQATDRIHCAQTETFAAYETRTGRSLVPAGQDRAWWLAHTPAERWVKVESDRVAESEAARAAWQQRKTAWEQRGGTSTPFTEPQPPLYVARPVPAAFE